MAILCVIIFLCALSSESESFEIDGIDSLPLQKQNLSTVWNIKLDIQFSKTLPTIIKKDLGTDVRLRCEAVLNFTNVEKYSKNKLESTLSESPPEHIVQALMKNVKVYWLKNKTPIANTSKTRVTTRIDLTNGTINTNLRLKNLIIEDEGMYSCVIKQAYPKNQTTRLIVVSKSSPDFDVPTYASLFPESSNITNSVSENIEVTTSVPPTPSLQILEPICQEYVGAVCDPYLKGHFVYIPINTSQATLEEKLLKAISVTKYSNDISTNCEGYAVPSLCYSTFPICREPISTNQQFFDDAQRVFITGITADELNSDTSKEVKQNYFGSGPHLYYDPNKTELLQRFDFRLNTTVLRRVCKDDCVILETELCQKEYAIAKRHPHIGQQLTLEECNNLPEQDPDCLPIGIRAVISDDECYWENGSGYTGKVGITSTGQQCIEWSKQMHINTGNFVELVGRHSYCRNPGGIMPQPWCFVGKGNTDRQVCDIPKCAHKIWIYIVVVFLLITLTIMGFIICLCYRNKGKNHATIRDINLPNADKNIYGDSRLNSPIEMSELLSGQNGPHLTRSTRGNAAVRVPQYSLSQIKFLEELGEGAFGKVYKGAIKCGNETTYVAVKALKENASAKTKADFRREIDLISELKHDNIVCIVGVALREEPLCMLFEFMARGDLHEFLMGRAPPAGKGLSALRLLSISNNIASGMDYLASHHYVHRDLAARNCLVSDDFVVKISDFGLSRDIYSSDYYRVQSKSLLPVRWMPPESILYGKFTTESDIWSYGVVLWEIYSYGLQPYYGFSNQEVIAMVRGGEKLAPPAGCPVALYSLMTECWEHTPQRRPNFADIVSRLQGWLESGGCDVSEHVTGRQSLPRERVPLLSSHMSNGSLTTGSLRKISVAGSSRMSEDARSTCSEVPPLAPKKKHSSGSLIDAVSAKDTIVRIPNAQCGNEI